MVHTWFGAVVWSGAAPGCFQCVRERPRRTRSFRARIMMSAEDEHDWYPPRRDWVEVRDHLEVEGWILDIE